MPVKNRILVEDGATDDIDDGLAALFALDAEAWTVTIRPSQVERRWTIEILTRGQFWSCSAGPGEQDAGGVVTLVRRAVGPRLAAGPQSQE